MEEQVEKMSFRKYQQLYNIHTVLWDLYRIKSRLLCKYNKHNYMLKINKEYGLIAECFCCNKIIKIIEEC